MTLYYEELKNLYINISFAYRFHHSHLDDIVNFSSPTLMAKEEYPFAQKTPGPLSFQFGGVRFRQLVWDRKRNRKPFKFTPGPLSFRIGPIRFNQIPQKHLPYDPCCTDPTASCYLLANCDL